MSIYKSLQDPSAKKRSSPPDAAVFVCLSLLGRAVGRSHLTNEFKDLLEPMLSVGLSPALTTCLRELATKIPLLKKDIAEGLLRMLSLVLMHQPLRHPGKGIHCTSKLHQLLQQYTKLLLTLCRHA